jgi:hypothetical protein
MSLEKWREELFWESSLEKKVGRVNFEDEFGKMERGTFWESSLEKK